MFLVVGSPQGCLEHVSVAGRPLRCDACVDMSLFDQFKTHSQCSLVTQVQSFGMGWTMVAGTHRQLLKPRMLVNNAGLGSQTATHLAENSPVASWGEGVAVVQDKARSRSPRRRSLRGLSGRELRDRMSKQGLLRQQAAASSAGSKQQATQCTPIPVYADCGVWEFPPARPTAPGCKRYRRGSALRIQNFGSNPREVLKAKSEYTDDKYAKSAVESVRSRLAWWQRRAKEHSVEAFPITVELLQLLGSLLKKAGYRSAGAYLSVVKNQHIRLANEHVQGALGRLKNAVPST